MGRPPHPKMPPLSIYFKIEVAKEQSRSEVDFDPQNHPKTIKIPWGLLGFGARGRQGPHKAKKCAGHPNFLKNT